MKRRERRVVPEADRVVTVVEEAREHYCRDCGVPPLRTQVVGNTVDQEVFDPESVEPASVDGLDDDRFTAAYVGGFGPHRGQRRRYGRSQRPATVSNFSSSATDRRWPTSGTSRPTSALRRA
ncbi:hypothetical protein [Halospeciosus flavus]|uniref:hypothetical protein n=1 Tax=Halospeciosus flavus TaxID=3032283 RepID=UPI0036117EB6